MEPEAGPDRTCDVTGVMGCSFGGGRRAGGQAGMRGGFVLQDGGGGMTVCARCAMQ